MVHLNTVAGSYAVATNTGQLFGVHPDPNAKRTVKLPKVGTTVSAPVKPLFNGTFEEKGARTESGSASGAKFSGTVGFTDAATSTYTVSVKGVSLLIHVPGAGAAAPKLPNVGDYVTVTASIEKGIPATIAPQPLPQGCEGPADQTPPEQPTTSLVQRKLSTPTPSTFLYFEGTIDGVCPSTDQLVISADDGSESMTDLHASGYRWHRRVEG